MMFYKETNFKDTEIGRIPEDWKVVKLEDACIEITDGSHWSPRQVEKSNYRIATVANLKEFYIDINSCKFISEEDYLRLVKEGDVPEEGDVLFSKDGTVGICFTFRQSNYKIGLLSSIAIIKPNKHILFSDFLVYTLKSPNVFWQVTGRKTGTALTRITLNNLKRVKIPLPPFQEQQRIAEILSTVDKAIQKTNEIIAKTERLKKGLMQELLTKGIGHKEFKDTEIGRIPKEWEVVKLGDDKIAEIRGNKIISAVQKVAFIPMELIPDHGIFVKYEIRDLKDVSSSTYCEAGDLLLAKITPSLENGKQGIVPDDIPNGFALATTEVYPIVCKGIDRLFLFYVLKFPRFRKILEFSMRGTTGRQRVPKDAVEKLKIPLPPYQEQKRIAEILSTFDKKLEIERSEKAKLEKIKQGLMDMLLTGKIRVKVNSNG
jgi:type I restriction enzyme S subunit